MDRAEAAAKRDLAGREPRAPPDTLAGFALDKEFAISYMSVFSPSSMSAAQYDEAMKRLDAAGAASPRGRLIHVCYGDEPNLRIMTVWESQDDFRAMAPPTLLPILKDVGVETTAPPEIHPVRDIRPKPTGAS